MYPGRTPRRCRRGGRVIASRREELAPRRLVKGDGRRSGGTSQQVGALSGVEGGRAQIREGAIAVAEGELAPEERREVAGIVLARVALLLFVFSRPRRAEGVPMALLPWPQLPVVLDCPDEQLPRGVDDGDLSSHFPCRALNFSFTT